MNLISDVKMIIAGISIFIIGSVIALHKAFKMGAYRENSKRINSDLEAANDAKQRNEDISTFDDDEFIKRVRDAER